MTTSQGRTSAAAPPPPVAPPTWLPLTTAAGARWQLTASDPVLGTTPQLPPDPVAATVPGEVHTDLLAAGTIPDPFDGDNESLLAWIGRTDWRYSTTFTWGDDGTAHHELVAQGLDTVARLELNGVELGRTADQHRTHRFDVAGVLVEGENHLVVEFSAPVLAAERAQEQLGARPHVNHHPYNALRKTASSFGWDWGIDLAGSGITGPIGIESWSGLRLASVRPLASVEGPTGVLTVHVELAGVLQVGSGAVVAARVAGREQRVPVDPVDPRVGAATSAASVRVEVPDAPLWWPRGHGDQVLHEVVVELLVDDHPAGTWSGRVGFRTVEVDTRPDEHGEPFVLLVNGQPVYVRGANWIPDDALLTRLTPSTYRAGVLDAVDAGCNLLRVWGGGIVESEDFYAACDDLGVLVWQDFLLACAAYSEEEPLRSDVEAEAREAISRLSRHASLAVWNGGNENLWGYEDWDWKEPLAGRTWGGGYYHELFPALVAELDPRTPYVPGSPYSPGQGRHPNDPASGPIHVWDVWNEKDYTHYRDVRPRFVSEFGFQGPPAWSTLTAVVHDEPLDPYGPQMLVHQKAADGNLKLERGLGEHLPRWRDIDEWHWATQLNQARAVAFGVEHWRSLFPLCTGTIVWQLNDCWPVVSWAAVDSAGIRKPLWHALRRVGADVLVTVQPREGSLAVVVHNDSPVPWRAQLAVARHGTGPGSPVLAHAQLPVVVAARSAATVELPAEVVVPADPTREVLRVVATAASADVAAALWRFVEDPELEVLTASDALDVAVAPVDGGYDVVVTARAFAQDVSLFPDRLDAAARVDSGLVTLLAGERHVFRVSSAHPLDEAALGRVPVLRTANDLVTGPR